MTALTESIVEEAALAWFTELGYRHIQGPELSPGEPAAERSSYAQVVLESRLRAALAQLNPTLPPDGLEEAYRKLTLITSPQLLERARRAARPGSRPMVL